MYFLNCQTINIKWQATTKADFCCYEDPLFIDSFECVCVYLCVCMLVCVCMFVCMCVFVYMYVSVCMYVCVCMYVSVCMYVAGWALFAR